MTTREIHDGIAFVCTQSSNASMPDKATNIAHSSVETVQECKQECMEAGSNQCNVYSFQPSSFAPNCTIGYASAYTKPLAYTKDKEGTAGYCIQEAQAQNTFNFPPPS